jgi:hypothetical protein
MIRSIAVFMFVLVVGVCSYVLLNPDCYAAPVLCLAPLSCAWLLVPLLLFGQFTFCLSTQAIGCRVALTNSLDAP